MLSSMTVCYEVLSTLLMDNWNWTLAMHEKPLPQKKTFQGICKKKLPLDLRFPVKYLYISTAAVFGCHVTTASSDKFPSYTETSY